MDQLNRLTLFDTACNRDQDKKTNRREKSCSAVAIIRQLLRRLSNLFVVTSDEIEALVERVQYIVARIEDDDAQRYIGQ